MANGSERDPLGDGLRELIRGIKKVCKELRRELCEPLEEFGPRPVECGSCIASLEIVWPDYVTPADGTCGSDPMGLDENGKPNMNVPATPPADGIWAKATLSDECKDCKVVTTTSFVNAQGNVVVQNDPAGSHPADGTFHRL